jgi:hypothetical protein
LSERSDLGSIELSSWNFGRPTLHRYKIYQQCVAVHLRIIAF